jgi:Asp-tRNA(Asn)/Glu-tRNA(Gln) amidotransferase A subunit family amidase
MTRPSAKPSAVRWLTRLEAGELSSRELTQRYLERIERVEPHIGAVAALDPDGALRAADEADRIRSRGEHRPLLGLPVTVKDSLEVRGLASTGGSLARAGHIPERDAVVVARLRRAGAFVLAKTNAPEYSSSYETANPLHGRTLHPLDPERTPGGSSGGEAALAAADATPLGIGTDGGGSIRVPAHYCGVVGLRPSAGRVPDTGNWPATRASGYMDFYCVGPIARFVEDAEFVLPLIAGPDGIDPYAVPAPLGSPEAVDPGVLRVGWFTDAPDVASTPGTVAAVATAARVLAGTGAQVREIEPPWEPGPTDLFLAAISADGGAQMRSDLAGAGGRHEPDIASLLETMEGRALTAGEWFALQRDIFSLRARVRALFANVDVLVCPVAPGPAPRHGEPPGPRILEKPLRAFEFVHLFAVAGLPAASVPVGREGELPVGVQVAGPPFREDIVLAAARTLESAVGGFRPLAPPAVKVVS